MTNPQVKQLTDSLIHYFCAPDRTKAAKTRRVRKLIDMLETQCGLRDRKKAEYLIRAFAANEVSRALCPQPERQKKLPKAMEWTTKPKQK